jgi:hypothetical protein
VAISYLWQQLNLDLHAKHPILTKFGICGQFFFYRSPVYEIYENPSSRSRADIFGGQKDGSTDVTNIMGAFRDFENSCDKRFLPFHVVRTVAITARYVKQFRIITTRIIPLDRSTTFCRQMLYCACW